MKKTKKWLLCFLLCTVGLCACGNALKTTEEATEEEVTEKEAEVDVTYSLGSTVSTDRAELSLEDADFSYYVSPNCEPIDESNGARFSAALGHVLIPMTFTITNKDRVTLDIRADGTLKEVGTMGVLVEAGNR